MLPTSGWVPSYRNVRPLTTRYIRAPFTPIAFRPRSTITTSVTKNFWRSVWLLVSGDTGSRERFIVWTDHQNLEYIRFAKRLNARQARWALFFGRFDFTISFRPGSKNPDALSRQFGSSEVSPTTENILPQRCVVGETRPGRAGSKRDRKIETAEEKSPTSLTGCLLGSGTGCEKSSFAGHQTSPRSWGNVIRSWGRSFHGPSLGALFQIDGTPGS